jgi:thioredoxin reductase
MTTFDIAVVGAGPAGLAAAAVASAGGAAVALIDAAPRPGGQFWRHRPHGIAADEDLHHDIDTFTKVRPGSNTTYLPEHQVWTVQATDEGCAVQALTPDRQNVRIDAKYLILAPGAYDRQIPFPGWDAPSVMTAGGVQALLKGQGVTAGSRVLVAGTGPFLLPVAAGLAQRGATVVGVHEANHPAAWWRHPHPVVVEKLPEAVGYLRVLRRHRVPVRYRSVVVAVEGAVATVAPISRNGGCDMSAAAQIPIDVVAVGWGFTPQLELPLAAGCATRVDADGSLVVITGDDQFTSQPRVLAAGEATGVGGAALALTEGAIAGAAAAGALGYPAAPGTLLSATGLGRLSATGLGRLSATGLGRLRRRRDRLRRFADAMARVYPVPAGWPERVANDTVVCRCEEVTAGELREATELGAADVRVAKLLSRAGMGWCQGRVCGYAASCLVAEWAGGPYDPRGMAERPVAIPLPLGALATDMSDKL